MASRPGQRRPERRRRLGGIGGANSFAFANRECSKRRKLRDQDEKDADRSRAQLGRTGPQASQECRAILPQARQDHGMGRKQLLSSAAGATDRRAHRGEFAFWRDYADYDSAAGKPFLSTNLAEPTHNFPEMMAALSLVDLPFKSADHKTDVQRHADDAHGRQPDDRLPRRNPAGRESRRAHADPREREFLPQRRPIPHGKWRAGR